MEVDNVDCVKTIYGPNGPMTVNVCEMIQDSIYELD
jgi:hypothetical protein